MLRLHRRRISAEKEYLELLWLQISVAAGTRKSISSDSCKKTRHFSNTTILLGLLFHYQCFWLGYHWFPFFCHYIRFFWSLLISQKSNSFTMFCLIGSNTCCIQHSETVQTCTTRAIRSSIPAISIPKIFYPGYKHILKLNLFLLFKFTCLC